MQEKSREYREAGGEVYLREPDCAAKLEAEADAGEIEAGMARKAAKFREKGGEVYLPVLGAAAEEMAAVD